MTGMVPEPLAAAAAKMVSAHDGLERERRALSLERHDFDVLRLNWMRRQRIALIVTVTIAGTLIGALIVTVLRWYVL